MSGRDDHDARSDDGWDDDGLTSEPASDRAFEALLRDVARLEAPERAMACASATHGIELNREVARAIGPRYELVEVVGYGGYATVYRATDHETGQSVAIKLLVASLAGRGSKPRQRFLQEAELIAALSHRHIARLLDCGVTANDQPYLVMELLEGCDLHERLRDEGPMETGRAVDLLLGPLDALAESHRRGIVHKDLKPENLFLAREATDERLVIVDFGVARIIERACRFTSTGDVSGTLQYTSPEYFQALLVTPALDVYQMGLVLVEMLSGRRAVPHASPERCVMAHMTGQLDIPDGVRQGPLWDVLQRALAIDHRARFRDAGELVRALHDLRSNAR